MEPFDGTLDGISYWHAKDFLAYQLAARSVQNKALNLARLDSVAPKRQREKILWSPGQRRTIMRS